jgi:hypothetical protein
MTQRRLNLRVVLALGLAGSVGALAAFRAGLGPEEDGLAVQEAGAWLTWWARYRAPHRWNGETPLADRVVWRPRLVVVRVDPQKVDLRLVPAFTRNRSWSVADADSGVVLALDAGQFRQNLPWGWVTSEGIEVLEPEYAPLAGAVIVDASGRVRVAAPDELTSERVRGAAREAFQSYPMLLQDGLVPRPLREPGHGVNLAHRDARLALGTRADGRVIIALTRFDALGPSLGRVPFGLTTPEMAAVMGALGCRRALLLDGGISGQLALRAKDGSVHRWPGTRRVPLGLVGRQR